MNRKDFPILKENLHYLDNAATTQKPKIVINTIKKYYETTNANTHRGIYKLADKATIQLEQARETFAKHLNAKNEEIIFTKNTTESLNLLSRGLAKQIKKTDEIITTEIEHHANFIPWQQLAQTKKAKFKVIEYNIKKQTLENIPKQINNKDANKNTKIITLTHMSNVTGEIYPIKKIIKQIRKINKNIIIIIDGAQAVAHQKINVKELDCDFYTLSTHKIYGPTGVGILYGKKELLKKIDPFLYGGHMIQTVTKEKSTWANSPEKFEAGTMNTADIIASAKAIDYINKIGLKKIQEEEHKLTQYALKKLKEENAIIIGHKTTNQNTKHKPKNTEQKYGSVISFNIKGIHPHDLATIADKYNVCIRAGHHCCQPLMNKLKITASARLSISFYNNKQDINQLIKAIKYAKKILI